jgi:hypothetical protein
VIDLEAIWKEWDAARDEGFSAMQNVAFERFPALLSEVTRLTAALEGMTQERNEQLERALRLDNFWHETRGKLAAAQQREAEWKKKYEDGYSLVESALMQRIEQMEQRKAGLREALKRIANDHNDGRYPDHRAFDDLQGIARAALAAGGEEGKEEQEQTAPYGEDG